MSIKSRLPWEVVNALNTLTVVTAEKSVSLPLSSCGDLIDTIMELLLDQLTGTVHGKEKDNYSSGYHYKSNDIPSDTIDDYQTSVDRLNHELSESLALRRAEQIKQRTELEQTAVESRRDQCQCLLIILRNLSFLPDNQVVIAQHTLISPILQAILELTYKDEQDDHNDQNDSNKQQPDLEAADIGELHQHTLILLSNISNAFVFTTDTTARLIIHFLVDWLDAAEHNRAPMTSSITTTIGGGTIPSMLSSNPQLLPFTIHSSTASLALETLARLTVHSVIENL
ncbi:hypothetical protein BDF19DRAFT_194990 [Syncephalis fuscata]|nr:hypothetical protein BDF19DRAFT_194990 [Syncephalis fuscata]